VMKKQTGGYKIQNDLGQRGPYVQKSGKVLFFSHLSDLYLIISRPWNLSHFFSHRDCQYNFHVESLYMATTQRGLGYKST
jgi:hypothetical protein